MSMQFDYGNWLTSLKLPPPRCRIKLDKIRKNKDENEITKIQSRVKNKGFSKS